MIPFKTKIHKGRIAVYSDRHKLVDSRLYYTSEGMKKIMGQWLDIFPSGFYIQVRPYDGFSNMSYRLDIMKDPLKEKLVRPAAVYNNCSTPYKYT